MASGPYKEHGVSLQRDTLSTPWGFRLQGGKDFKAPLTVQRVFVGSPADGVLHRGDVIVSIENHDCANMNHRPAQDIIKQAGGTMRMRVRRGASFVSSQVPPKGPLPVSPGHQLNRGPLPTAGALAFVPKPRPPAPSHASNAPSFGQDYTKSARFPKTSPGQSPAMLSKVQQSLNQALWQPGMYDEPEFDQRPVHDLRSQFEEPPHPDYYVQGHQHYPSQPRAQQAFKPPPAPAQRARGTLYIEPAGSQPENYLRSPLPYDENYAEPQRPVRDLKNVFTERHEPAQQRPRTGYTTKPWHRPAASDSKPLYEPGWAPGQKHPQQERHDRNWAPVRGPQSHQPPPASQHHHPQAPPQHRPAYEVPRIAEPSSPAWAGTLKSSGGIKPWEVAAANATVPHEAPQQMPGRSRPAQQAHAPAHHQMPSQGAQPHGRPSSQEGQRPRTRSPQADYVPVHQPRVQSVHYAPGKSPEYQQHDPDSYEGDARIAHLQYNTPLGLYSRENVEETLRGQTAGKPGEGTMIVTGDGRGPPPAPGKKQFDPKHSSVLQMLQEQEAAPKHQNVDQSARYIDHDAGQEMQYQGYMDHHKQSPSMHALETNVGSHDAGTSDF